MKRLITNYSFDKTAKTVTFSDYAAINLERVLIITNATSNIIIYNFADATKGGTVTTNVLTLTYDTSAMANTDKLQIYYDDPTYDNSLKEDAAHTSSDPGVMALAVRESTATDLSVGNTNGDYEPLQVDANGRLHVINSSGIAGDVAGAAADSGNPVKVGAKYNSSLPTYTNGQRSELQVGTRGALMVEVMSADTTLSNRFFSDNGDGVTVSSNSNLQGVVARNTVFNGTSWDRRATVVNATNSTGTGIASAGLVAQLDDTSPTAITENQFGNVRMNSARALYHESGPYSAGRVTADGQIKASAGFIHTITISPTTATPTAGLITVYDNTAESGTVVFSEWFFATDQAHTITLDVVCSTGIYVGYDATATNLSVTVSYR